MSGFIPKEKLTAYQRWELAAFDEAEQAAKAVAAEPPPAPEEPPPALPTAEDIERIHSEAYAAGYADGQAAGLEAGHAEGYAAGEAEARVEAERIAALGANLIQHLQAIDQEIAEELLTVAVGIASQVLRQSLRVKPELLLPVVREAMAALPLAHAHPALFLNPTDAALVRSQLGEQLAHKGWRILEDSSIEAGGCRIESGTSEVDATLSTRWQRVLDTIGSNSDWLDGQP
jgi:flagellar assembly protein FliH